MLVQMHFISVETNKPKFKLPTQISHNVECQKMVVYLEWKEISISLIQNPCILTILQLKEECFHAQIAISR